MLPSIDRFVRRAWWALPALSGALLVLTFHPFNFWPLCFVALVPLYYFAASGAHTLRRLFLGGFITGAGFAFMLSYYTVAQFHWLPEAYLFVDLVRAAAVPISLVSGVIVGGLTVVFFRYLYGNSTLMNALLGGALYTLAELLLRTLFGGYYLAELGYAATPMPPLMPLAAVGGGSLLSFVIALVNAYWVAVLMYRAREWPAMRRVLRDGAILALIVCALAAASAAYLREPGASRGSLSIVLLQDGGRDQTPFGREQNGTFFWAEGSTLAAAASTSPDLVIYPFSPVEGALYRSEAPALNKAVLVASEAAVGAFARATLPASTTLLTWNNLYADGRFYNEYELWQGGAVAGEYRKRHLFPFMDYTPSFAARVGLYTTPFDVVPGPAQGGLTVRGIALGDLMCSEVHDTGLARAEAARGVPLIIAVGSEAMFEDDVASQFSLKAAQMRAAENDVAVVRGNVLGPSAIIDRHGRLVASIPSRQPGLAEATLALSAPKPTLYNRLGDGPLIALICGILVSAWYTRSRAGVLMSTRW